MQCIARVAVGAYSYAARSSERQCKNTATHGNYCHAHRGRNVTPRPTGALDALRAQLTEG